MLKLMVELSLVAHARGHLGQYQMRFVKSRPNHQRARSVFAGHRKPVVDERNGRGDKVCCSVVLVVSKQLADERFCFDHMATKKLDCRKPTSRLPCEHGTVRSSHKIVVGTVEIAPHRARGAAHEQRCRGFRALHEDLFSAGPRSLCAMHTQITPCEHAVCLEVGRINFYEPHQVSARFDKEIGTGEKKGKVAARTGLCRIDSQRMLVRISRFAVSILLFEHDA